MGDLTFRKATVSDYQAIMDINREVYDGFDYLPNYYRILIKDKRVHGYVAEEGGKVVSFIQFAVLDHGRKCLSGAARTSKEAVGKNINGKLNVFAKEHLKKCCPALKREIWLAVWNDHYVKKHEKSPERLISIWHFVLYTTTKEAILQSKLMKSKKTVNRTTELDPTRSEAILKNRKNQRLFDRVPLIAYHWWTPVFVSEESQLKEFCLLSKIFASEVTPSFEVSALSSSAPVLCQNGVISCIFFHSIPSADDLYFDHLQSHLEHICSIAADNSRVSLALHFPLEITDTKAKEILTPDFGEPLYNISPYSKVGLFEVDY